MSREAGITTEQVFAIADSMTAAGVKPTSRAVRERLGNTGSMGTINKMLQAWKVGQERQIASSLTLPAPVQRTILEFLSQELASAKATLESDLADQQQETSDLANENERQAAEIENKSDELLAVQTELATLQGRTGQMEVDLHAAETDAARERDAAESARTELAKAQLRLEAMPRLEADLTTVRSELEHERQGRVAAEQNAAVLGAKLEASQKHSADTEGREKAARDRVHELERQVTAGLRELANANLSAQACQARLESAARELDDARKQAAESRENAKRAGEEAAELRGRLETVARELADARKEAAESRESARRASEEASELRGKLGLTVSAGDGAKS